MQFMNALTRMVSVRYMEAFSKGVSNTPNQSL